MSYILEALKRSQQERALGQVPTLASSALLREDKEPQPVHHWGLLAVLLAALAIVIALYAALRGVDSPVAGAGAVRPALPADPAASGASQVAVPSVQSLTAAPSVPVVVQPVALSRPPLVEAPPPKQTVRASRPVGAADPGLGGQLPPTPGTEHERLPRLDAGQGDPDEASVDQPSPVPIPPDLIQDIEQFKRQVRRVQGAAPATTERQPADIAGDPTRLRLTPQQQAQLPAFVMTVHVYDAEASQRFVVIDSLRYAEGEETREGLRVERILHDGAVLSYQGNPFYVPR